MGLLHMESDESIVDIPVFTGAGCRSFSSDGAGGNLQKKQGNYWYFLVCDLRYSFL